MAGFIVFIQGLEKKLSTRQMQFHNRTDTYLINIKCWGYQTLNRTHHEEGVTDPETSPANRAVRDSHVHQATLKTWTSLYMVYLSPGHEFDRYQSHRLKSSHPKGGRSPVDTSARAGSDYACKDNPSSQLIIILNGRFSSDKTVGEYTFKSLSVIDYCISSILLLDKFSNFEIKDPDNLLSDGHSLLSVSLAVNSRLKTNNTINEPESEHSLKTCPKWQTDKKEIPEKPSNPANPSMPGRPGSPGETLKPRKAVSAKPARLPIEAGLSLHPLEALKTSAAFKSSITWHSWKWTSLTWKSIISRFSWQPKQPGLTCKKCVDPEAQDLLSDPVAPQALMIQAPRALHHVLGTHQYPSLLQAPETWKAIKASFSLPAWATRATSLSRASIEALISPHTIQAWRGKITLKQQESYLASPFLPVYPSSLRLLVALGKKPAPKVLPFSPLYESPFSPFGPFTPSSPGIPSSPLSPSNPGNPGSPDKPLNPSCPSRPGRPEVPGNPGSPFMPVKPSSPGDPRKPGSPSSPRIPTRPKRPGSPGAPGSPLNDIDIALMSTNDLHRQNKEDNVFLPFCLQLQKIHPYQEHLVLQGNRLAQSLPEFQEIPCPHLHPGIRGFHLDQDFQTSLAAPPCQVLLGIQMFPSSLKQKLSRQAFQALRPFWTWVSRKSGHSTWACDVKSISRNARFTSEASISGEALKSRSSISSWESRQASGTNYTVALATFLSPIAWESRHGITIGTRATILSSHSFHTRLALRSVNTSRSRSAIKSSQALKNKENKNIPLYLGSRAAIEAR
ncbi:PLS-like protein [Mya arenaria]|uniref:PLS-like protein n=1 Tax=Mya arenaria TaxID=6604 RepID=A0ABY7G254_MYAAR|nr:PLS-like protein [Mya arenaria]